MTLLLALLTTFGAWAQSELTVYEGTNTSNIVPAYMFYFDDFTRSQFVIPADDLEEMNGGTISSIKFYTTSNNVPYTAVSSAKVYLMEVDYTTMTGLEPTANGTIVYEGYFDVVSEGDGGSLTIEFSTPYTYGGGNLLIGIENTTDTGYKNIGFYGTSVTGASWAGSDGTSLDNVTGSQRNFIPQTTFTYTPGSGPTCEKPSTFVVSDVTAHEATFSWISEVGNYCFEYKKSTDEEWTDVYLSAKTFTLTALTQNTAYNARVKAICGEGSESNYKTVNFTTLIACPTPSDLAVTLTPGDGTVATLSWTETGDATAWVVAYKTANAEEFIEVNTTENPYMLTGLTPETAYTAKVKAVCGGEDGESQWSSTITFTPTNAYSITVNDGTTTNSYVPIYGYWADSHSKSQFIIPATALAAMQYGTINKLTFYSSNASVSWGSAEFEVYVKEVGYTSFEYNTLVDWTTMEKVKNAGTLAISDNKMEVTLDAPYQYMGGNLMIGIIETTSGSYSSCNWYGVSSEENVAIGGYESSKGISYLTFLPKTTFDYTPGEAPACAKPTGLTVNYTEGTTATVSWTSDADAWQFVFVNEEGSMISTINTIYENPYTLTGLDLGTTYRLAIRTVCGEGNYSEWTSLTSPVTFTTDNCMPEDKIIVNYELNDSYGDGWNNNYILVVDENCEIVEALTLSSGSSATGTVKVCGSVAQFMWYMGSYPGETSWTFTDAEGNVLFEGTGNTSMNSYDVLYTIDLNPYSMPTDIEVSEVGPYSAKVAWTETGTATAWEIGFFDDGDALINTVNANSNPFTLTGLDPNTSYYIKVRAVGSNETSLWPCVGTDFTTTSIANAIPYDLAVSDITPTSALVSWKGYGESYDLRYMAVSDSKGFTANSNAKPNKASRNNLKGLFASAPKSFANTNIRNINAKAKAKNSRDGWYYYDNGEYSSSIGTGGSDVYWAIMLPAGMLTETTLTKISLYETSGGTNDEPITLSVYAGGTDAPGTLLYEEEFETEAASDWHEVTLTEPVEINPLQNLWIVLKEYGTYPASGSTNTGDANGRWISLDGENWIDIADAGYDYTWMIRAYLEGTYEDPNWINVLGINASEYELTNLDPETTYVVQIRANFGEDEHSNWTSVNFTTPSACDAPIDLAVADVTDEAAMLSWTGYQDSYNVRYRSSAAAPTAPATIILEANDVWEDGSGYQLLLDADANTYGTLWNANHIIYVDGEQYSGGDLPTEYYDEFEYKIPSEADGSLSTENIVATGTVTITIPAGTYDYVILNPTPGERFYIAGDNGEVGGAEDDFVFESGVTYHFTMQRFGSGDGAAFEVIRPMGDWTEVENVTTPYEITGLTQDTYYEWQVQGVNAGCDDGVTDWSETSTFTTWGVENINFAAEGYATYYNSKRDVVLPEGMKAHVVTDGSTTLTYDKVADGDEETKIVPAGTAMLLQVEPGQTLPVYLARPSVAAYTGTNLLHGSDTQTTTSGEGKHYKLTYSTAGTNFGWYWGADNGGAFSSPANKAWLVVPASSGAPFLGLPDWEETTGIVPVGVNPEDGEWYTLQGMKVGKKPTTAGVYIHNGRKVIIK